MSFSGLGGSTTFFLPIGRLRSILWCYPRRRSKKNVMAIALKSPQKMPVAGSHPDARAHAHMRWAARYARQNEPRKVSAHIESALRYQHRRGSRGGSVPTRFGTGFQFTFDPPKELVDGKGRMTRLVVDVEPLGHGEGDPIGDGGYLVKGRCVYMSKLEKTELDVAVEMSIVSLRTLDMDKLLGILHPGFPSVSIFGSHQNNPHKYVVTRGMRANATAALEEIKKNGHMNDGPGVLCVVVVSKLTVSKTSQGPDAQAEGIGLRVLHRILGNLGDAGVSDVSPVIISTDPYDAGGIPPAVTEAGSALDRDIRLAQFKSFGFEARFVSDGSCGIMSARLAQIGAYDGPIPSAFFEALRFATGETLVEMTVTAGGLMKSLDGTCFVRATIMLPFDVMITITDMPFSFAETGTPTIAKDVVEAMMSRFYKIDVDGRKRTIQSENFNSEVLPAFEDLHRTLSLV